MASSSVFSGSEIVEMAIRTEQSGFRFYGAAAQRVQSDEVRQLLEWLRDQEAMHERAFRKLLGEHESEGPREQYAGQKGEFIQALLDSRVFGADPLLERDLASMSDEQVLDYALGFEKDTILFMYEMRELVSEMQRFTVDRLIAEEKSHVQRLHSMRKT